MVVIAKNGPPPAPPPNFFTELLKLPGGCCHKSSEDWQYEYELNIKGSWKISSHIETSQFIFKKNQLASSIDDKFF